MAYLLTYSGNTDADLDFYIDGTSIRVSSTDPAQTVEASHIKLVFQDDPRTVTVNGQVVYDEFGPGEYELTLVADTTITLGFDNVIEYTVAPSVITLDLSTIGLSDGVHSIQMGLSDDNLVKLDSDLSEAVEYTALHIDPVMNNNDWSTIFAAFKTGRAPESWAVGDTKQIVSKSGITYTLRLCDKQEGRYQYSDGSGSSKAVFEFVELMKIGETTEFQMNTTDINIGGWRDSYMRNTVIPQIEADLPDDLVSAFVSVNVISGMGGPTQSGTNSSANKLFLPAEMELFSTKHVSYGISECPLGQFDYYKSHDTNEDRVKRIVGTTTASVYWERSPRSAFKSAFCCIDFDGSYESFGANRYFGIAPIFAV